MLHPVPFMCTIIPYGMIHVNAIRDKIMLCIKNILLLYSFLMGYDYLRNKEGSYGTSRVAGRKITTGT